MAEPKIGASRMESAAWRLSDPELQHLITVTSGSRDRRAEDGGEENARIAEFWAELLEVLIAERDRRRRLRAEGKNPF